MIPVFQCIVFGMTPLEVISDDMVVFVEENVKSNAIAFKLKIVKEGENPSRITTAVIGYYYRYGVPYMSNPDRNQGLSAVDITNKRIVYDPRDAPFFSERDAIVYSMTPFDTFIRESYADVLREFTNHGYSFFRFNPRMDGDWLCRYQNPTHLPVGAKIALEEML